MPKVSIITPVYKAEQYIHRCLDSILNQTLSDWECILVDDGSPDSCGLICDIYSRKDSRFKVIHKSNGGVAEARQVGINAAVGEYSIHVDPDDYIEPSMLESMYTEIKRQNVDVLVCDYTVVFGGGKKKRIRQKPSGYNTKDLAEDILLQKLHGSLCNKIIKHSSYKDYNIHFYPKINNCEDVLIWVQFSKYKLSVGYHPKSYYYYCLNQYSITSSNSYSIENYKALKQYINKLYEFVDISNQAKQVATHFVKLKALENGVMTRDEYYSFCSPSLQTVLLTPAFKDKVFGLFAYFKLYYIGLSFYGAISGIHKFLSFIKKKIIKLKR